MKKNQKNQYYHLPITIACVCSILYWSYLIYISQIIMVYDSLDYENLGRVISSQGWGEYFKTGPNREPTYPALVALSMKLAPYFGATYQTILKVFQSLLLLLTQLMVAKLLIKANINRWLVALSILYIGFSPAIINSTLSLYSEISIMPFIVGTILFIITMLKVYEQSDNKIKVIASVLFGIFLCFLTLTKAVFEMIAPLIIIYIFALTFLRSKTSLKIFAKKHIFLIIITTLSLLLPLNGYKLANKAGNGNYTITNRGSWALYGSVEKRMQKMPLKKLFSSIYYVPGEGVCHRITNPEYCNYWSFRTSDDIGIGMAIKLGKEGYTQDEMDKYLLNKSFKRVLENPFRFGALMIVESLKMIFYETGNNIGFVVYPSWLAAIYANHIIIDAFSLIIALAVFISIISLILYLLNEISRSLSLTKHSLIIITIFFVLFCYSFFYSLFFIVPRYATPIAPLLIALLALAINRLLVRNSK